MNRLAYVLVLLTVFLSIYCTAKTVKVKVDVLVVNGGAGGTTAAIQSARLGARTLIVEPTPWLGGMLTSAGVSCTDGNHNLPSGLWAEFRQKLYNSYGGPEQVATGWVSATQFEPHVGDSIFKAMVKSEINLNVIYGYNFKTTIRNGKQVTGARFLNKQGDVLLVNAKIVIDATEMGDVMKDAGAPYDLGMEARSITGELMGPEKSNNIIQDLTYAAVLKDYGPGTDKTIIKPKSYNPKLFRGSCNELVDGTLIECSKMIDYGRLPHGKYMINWPRRGNDIYLNIVEMNDSQRQRELAKAKEHTLNFIYYIQHELGYKNLGLADDEFPTKDKLPFIAYFREGRRLKGVVRFTVDQIINPYACVQKLYRTGIAVGDYPIDHHHAKNPDTPKIKFPQIPSFSIPLGALIPIETDGLVVAEKGISVSNIVNGTTRLQPCVMLTGQAAGTLAALSVIQKKQPREIDVRSVQTELLRSKAYLLPLFDITPDDEFFVSAQKIVATGILKTKGISYKWANQTWFYPDSTVTKKELIEALQEFEPNFHCDSSEKVLSILESCEIIKAFLNSYKGYFKSSVGRQLKSVSFNELSHWIESNWNKVSRNPFYLERPIKKIELAVLIDQIIDPFNLKGVGFDGVYNE